MARITKLERQKGAAGRISVFVDGRFLIGLSVKAVRELELGVGLEVTDKLHSEIIRTAALESAIMSLSRREHSRAELAAKLRQKGYADRIVKSTLDELQERGYLDDRRFARLWIERRSVHHPRGRRLLALELEQKGVSAELAREALAEDFSEASEREVLINLVRKRLRTLSGSDPQVFQRRLLAFLARRGFSYDDIRQVLAEHFPEL